MTAAIQKSLIPCPVIPSPCEDYGWIIKDGLFRVIPNGCCGNAEDERWKPVPDELIWISCSNRRARVWVTKVYVGHTDFHVRTFVTVTPVKIKVKALATMNLTKKKMKLK